MNKALAPAGQVEERGSGVLVMQRRRIGWLLGAAAGIALLSACAQKEVILPGERLSVRADLTGLPDTAPLDQAQGISLPAAQANAEWAQRGGNARHAAPHAALSANPQLAFATTVGQGSSRRNRISVAPVVAGGRVFTMDALSTVAAVSTGGGLLWQSDLTAGYDGKTSAVSGGGLAAGEGKVFATTGFGELVALDPASGGVLWRQRLGAPAVGAPVVDGGVVYVAARDGGAWAVNAADGRVVWQLAGTPGASGYLGTAAPTVGDRAVFFPQSSGEVMAVLKTGGGTKVWQESVAGKRPGRAFAQNADITGDAALIGSTLYTGTGAGRMVAMDAGSGQKIWSVVEGAMGPLAIAGGSVFAVNDEARLVRLDQATGRVIWSVEMPYFEAEKTKKRKAITAHYGPVLAGGRLWVASSDGILRGFSPQSGALTAQAEIPGGAATQPAVAGGTLYVVSNNGQLLAFR